MLYVGLCGRSGAGKGFVCAVFARFGIPSIDTDAVYREMTSPADVISPCLAELKDCFGDKIVNADNSLNRAEMRKLVFGTESRENLDRLNEISHRHILIKTKEIAAGYEKNGADAVIIDAPLLFESGFDRFCDIKVCVTADENTLVERIMKRDGIGRDDALKRLAKQADANVMAAKCDYVIENNGDAENVKRQAEAVVNRLKELKENGKL